MSEPINSGFPFPGMESSEELDINAIFGGSAPANDINPFDTPTEQSEEPASPSEQPNPKTPAAPVEPAAAPAAPVTQPEPAPAIKPAPQTQTQSTIPAREPANPISAAIDKQETQTAKRRPGLCLKSSPFSPMAAPRMRSPMEP